VKQLIYYTHRCSKLSSTAVLSTSLQTAFNCIIHILFPSHPPKFHDINYVLLMSHLHGCKDTLQVMWCVAHNKEKLLLHHVKYDVFSLIAHIQILYLLLNLSDLCDKIVYWYYFSCIRMVQVKNTWSFLLKTDVFWITVPCSLEEVYRCLRGTCCLHHQGDDRGTSSPWWWGQQALLKWTSTRPHGATTQKTAIFILKAMRTWNLNEFFVISQQKIMVHTLCDDINYSVKFFLNNEGSI
jgi:hypothetical protein